MGETRKLAAILVADVVGYSRLAGADEDRTLARLRGLRSDLIDPAIAAHHGRIVKRTGDGAIIEFRSVVDAVRCAIEVQNGMIERNSRPAARSAASSFASASISATSSKRATATSWATASISPHGSEGIAEPGAICLSEDAYRQVKGWLDLAVHDLGPKNSRTSRTDPRLFAQVGVRQGEARPGLRGGKIRAAAPLDRRLALRQHRRRPGTGAFRRRRHREPDDRSVAHPRLAS